MCGSCESVFLGLFLSYFCIYIFMCLFHEMGASSATSLEFLREPKGPLRLHHPLDRAILRSQGTREPRPLRQGPGLP